MAIIQCWTPGYRTNDSLQFNNSSPTYDTSIERGEGASLNITPVTTGTPWARIGKQNITIVGNHVSFDVATVTVRVYMYIVTLPGASSEEILGVTSMADTTTPKVRVRLHSDGKLSLWSGTGTTQIGSTGTYALSTGTWYRLEWIINTGSSATMTLKVYDDNDTTQTLLDTVSGTGNLSTSNAATLVLGKHTNRNGQGYSIRFATVAVRDSSTELGHAKGKLLLPNANGTYTSFTGTGSNGYQECDEVPHDGTTTQVGSTSAGGETYNLQSTTDVGMAGTETINCFVGGAMARTTATPVNTSPIVISGATEQLASSSGNLATGFSYRCLVLENNPNTSAAWTHAAINAVEVGMKNAGAGGTTQMTAAYGYVEYVPSSAPAAVPRSFVVMA